ncbi:MAG: hypothetical protein QOH61_1388 [Chloroflexota bacterium]|nr:hypothetical protein [Chloroflexota bacterium]
MPSQDLAAHPAARKVTTLAARPSRASEVLEVLRTAIVSGEIVPGSLHSVAELASSFGVSRTPVREALIELAGRGMVRFERNRGVRVLQTSVHDLEEIFELRLILEVTATRRAIERITPDARRKLRAAVAGMKRASAADDAARLWVFDRSFHHTLLVQAGNRRLADYVDSLRDMVLVRGVTTAGLSRTLDEIVDEHQVVLDFIEAGDAEGAAEAMRRHIAQTAELIIQQESRSR